MRSLSGQKQQRKQLMYQIVGSYLETSTAWGKRYARPSQVRAAAKRMVEARRIPKAVADALLEGVSSAGALENALG